VRALFDRDLGSQAFYVSADGDYGERLFTLPKFQRTVAIGDAPLDVDSIPCLRVTDVRNRNIVVLAPEKRDECARFFAPDHIARGDLAVTLGHDPVLDADFVAAVRVRPACDVPRSENPRGARFQIFVDHDAAIDR